MNEQRIYVIVAETVEVGGYSVDQSAGRIAAQCAHVVSKMRVLRALREKEAFCSPITTIILSVRSSAELEHMHYVLTLAGVHHEFFMDTNEEVYGYDHATDKPCEVMTALATRPIERERLEKLIDHLSLWTPECEKGKAA